jgi:beta-lactamase regulating signal transducer with metallopeptidase domain
MLINNISIAFWWILKTSFTASILLIILIAIKTLFKNKFNPRFHYVLWYLLILKLIIPFDIQSHLSIFNFINPQAITQKVIYKATHFNDINASPVTEGNNSAQNSNISKLKTTSNTKVHNTLHSKDKTSNRASLHHKNSNDKNTIPPNALSDSYIFKIISLVWFTVFAIILLLTILLNIKFLKTTKNNQGTIKDATKNVFISCKAALNIHKNIQLICTDKITSPSLLGLFNAFILLPPGIEDKLDESELKYIFFHELSHLKCKDLIINYLTVLIKAIYWFNPLLWYGFYRMKQDRELACDASVLFYLDKDETKSYGLTIVKLLESYSKSPNFLLTTGLIESKQEIRRRILMIKLFNKEKSKLSPAGVIILLLAAATLLTSEITANTILSKAAEPFKSIKQTDNVKLTLNNNIQKISDSCLKQALIDTKARRGSITIIDTKTGKVLAFSNIDKSKINTSFNLFEQKYGNNILFNKGLKNYSIDDTFEPGSIFKPIIAAAAIQEKLVNYNTQFYCSGSMQVADRQIKCAVYPHAHGKENFVQSFENSCDIAYMTLGLKLGVKKMDSYVKAFGLMQKTGIDIPGESQGFFYNPKKMNNLELAIESLGQGIVTTPIGMLNAINTIANNGKLMKPYVIAKVIRNNKTVKITKPQVIRQAVSNDTASKVRHLMELSLKEGAAKNGKPNNITAGGVTATVEKLPRGAGKYVASFCGFAPADKPKISIIICIDEPSQATHFGRIAAAPVFKSIVEQINKLHLLN